MSADRFGRLAGHCVCDVCSEPAAPPAQGYGGLLWIRVARHCAGPSSRPRKWRQFHSSQPPRDGE
eukprot:8411374-Pyramimonas_sp.AAC.1